MTTVDPFGRTDRLDEGMLQTLVECFEARGEHPRFVKMLEKYLDAMHVDRAGSVLDVGCGTGLAARAIARRPGFSGRVTGVDLSPYLVEAARRLARDEGLGDRTEFRTGDAERLDLADGTFDAVVAHTLLSHVQDPMTVLGEIARVVKPGGMVGVFDGDYASLTFDHADPAKAKAYDQALIEAVVTNPRVMRQMPRMLRAVKLELVTSFFYVLAEAGAAKFWSSAIETYRPLVARAGVMTEDEASAWAASLLRDSESGVFFGSSNFHAYVARRPVPAA